MKIPITPSGLHDLLGSFVKDPGKLAEMLTLRTKPDSDRKYQHWDKLRHLKLPAPFANHEVMGGLALALDKCNIDRTLCVYGYQSEHPGLTRPDYTNNC